MKRFWFNSLAALTALLLAVALYRAKSEADAVRARVVALEAQIAHTRAETKVLAAEGAVLDSPARVERLARRHLNMAPPEEKE